MDDDSTARLAYLLRLRKGRGVQLPHDDAPLALFRAADWEALVAFVEECIQDIDDQAEYEAVRNALGYGPVILEQAGGGRIVYNNAAGGPVDGLLKDRREDYARMRKMSVRTLMRYEASGFEQLGRIVDEKIMWRNPLHIVYKMEQQFSALKQVVRGEVSDATLQLIRSGLASAERDIGQFQRKVKRG